MGETTGDEEISSRSQHRHTVSSRSIADRDSKPKKEREPLTARRLSGGGRRTKLTDDQEKELEKWVMSLRECAEEDRRPTTSARSTFRSTRSDHTVDQLLTQAS